MSDTPASPELEVTSFLKLTLTYVALRVAAVPGHCDIVAAGKRSTDCRVVNTGLNLWACQSRVSDSARALRN